MPLREPRLELDRKEINSLLGWSGVTMDSICRFVREIAEASSVKLADSYVYNRGQVELEDTERRGRECWMISIWDNPIEMPESQCLFQQPVPIKIRYAS